MRPTSVRPCALTHWPSGLQEGARAHQPVQRLELLAAASAAGAVALLPRREATAGRRQQQAAHRAAHIHAVVICRGATRAEQRACTHALLGPPACRALRVLGPRAWPHPARCRPASQNACAARPVRNSRLFSTCKRSKFSRSWRRQALPGRALSDYRGVLVLAFNITQLPKPAAAFLRNQSHRLPISTGWSGQRRAMLARASRHHYEQSLRTDCSQARAEEADGCGAPAAQEPARGAGAGKADRRRAVGAQRHAGAAQASERGAGHPAGAAQGASRCGVRPRSQLPRLPVTVHGDTGKAAYSDKCLRRCTVVPHLLRRLCTLTRTLRSTHAAFAPAKER